MGCEWPQTEHGILVDHNDYVYIGALGAGIAILTPACCVERRDRSRLAIRWVAERITTTRLTDPPTSYNGRTKVPVAYPAAPAG
jgi:hypothetical protein